MTALNIDEEAAAPSDELNIAGVAALMAEPARAAILAALLDRRALPAGELAYRAMVTPQTASAHLAKLLEGGLLDVEICGRHRYYRLAGSAVAQAIEALAALSPLPDVRPERLDPRRESLRYARTCYDHLAGKLAVDLADAFVEGGLLEAGEREFRLTPEGREKFEAWGIDADSLRRDRGPLARVCLDWTERRHHIAGPLGTAVLAHLVRAGWIARVAHGRKILLTELGRESLRREVGLRL